MEVLVRRKCFLQECLPGCWGACGCLGVPLFKELREGWGGVFTGSSARRWGGGVVGQVCCVGNNEKGTPHWGGARVGRTSFPSSGNLGWDGSKKNLRNVLLEMLIAVEWGRWPRKTGKLCVWRGVGKAGVSQKCGSGKKNRLGGGWGASVNPGGERLKGLWGRDCYEWTGVVGIPSRVSRVLTQRCGIYERKRFA